MISVNLGSGTLGDRDPEGAECLHFVSIKPAWEG